MPKLKKSDTSKDIIIKMVEGTPGAIRALCSILEHGEEINPYASPIESIKALDFFGIYGSAICILWKDECAKEVRRFLVLLCCAQYGHISAEQIKAWSEEGPPAQRISPSEWDSMEKFIAAELPKFQKPEEG